MPFRQELIEVFVFFGTIAAACFTIDHNLHKIDYNEDKIYYLSSRLEECEKSRELKKIKS